MQESGQKETKSLSKTSNSSEWIECWFYNWQREWRHVCISRQFRHFQYKTKQHKVSVGLSGERVSNITLQPLPYPKKKQQAVLLHLASTDVQDIFETLEDMGDNYDTGLAKLNE